MSSAPTRIGSGQINAATPSMVNATPRQRSVSESRPNSLRIVVIASSGEIRTSSVEFLNRRLRAGRANVCRRTD